ncbi:DUF6695 family protein [Lacinutrix undariae]
MTNTGLIITLGYPETIVRVAEEWYSPFLRFIGVGKKNYVRAGHAALVLIDKKTGVLEYYDFGRYITLQPYGRVRGRDTDHELDFTLKAIIENGVIVNLNEILHFLATQPKLTHGKGPLYASVCSAVDYKRARIYIDEMLSRNFVNYAAFTKGACNCARFVTDTVIQSTTDISIQQKLKQSKWFTPSTLGNVVISDTENKIYKISDTGEFLNYNTTVSKENRRLFLDKLKGHESDFIGTLHPKENHEKNEKAQWLSGIGSGAWFELHDVSHENMYRFRRVSADGDIDVDGLYRLENTDFDIHSDYEFAHHSNCKSFYVKQAAAVYEFEFVKKYA